jgi:oligopeptide/dipeptide ABC transporter ATP-binding protein
MKNNNMNNNIEKVVEIKNLSKWFPLKHGFIDYITGKPKKYIKAVNDVSFDIYKGEILGLVGESGCGKSTLARNIVRLYKPTKGNIILNGIDITSLKGKELREIRPSMQMIFQDPYSSLNPRMSVREIIGEMLKVHNIVENGEVENRIKELLEMSGLSMEVADRFPGEFSGGQRQRIGIARALSLEPELIIADEPVSALDVSIQAQIINLLDDLQKNLNLTVLFIAHNLEVVRYITNRIVVMYLGGVVELGITEEVFENPYHPYTLALTRAAPSLDPTEKKEKLAIEGEIPSPINMPSGCTFHQRCPYCKDICKTEKPEYREVRPGRFVSCHFPLI